MDNTPVNRRNLTNNNGNKSSTIAVDRSSVFLMQDQLDELQTKFLKIDVNGDGFIQFNELRDALKVVGIDLPGYKVREITDKFVKNDSNRDGKLSLEDFKALYMDLKNLNTFRHLPKEQIGTAKDVDIIGGNSGAMHTIRHSERYAFSKWINQNLAKDADLNLELNPINPEDKDLYKRCSDGILLCKLINLSVADTIDERAINKGKNITIYQQLENLELALNSAEVIGCHIVSIRPADIRELKEHLIMGLLWQIIQIGLFAEINLTHHPGLVSLLRDGEQREDLLKLSKEALLLRWFNYHLSRSGYEKEVKNFSTDIKDSIAYVYLLHQIAPKSTQPPLTLNALSQSDVLRRAERMLQDAERLNVKEFITPKDVVEGNAKLNMAFVANLFNTYPALDTPANTENSDVEIIEETREEKTYRNWINSLGPYKHTQNQYVNYLYTDLQDCLIIFQLYDMIKPSSVDWTKVIKTFNKIKIKFEILSNCNYAVHLGVKTFEFKLVGIQGSNLLDGDKLHTLALVWQLMRAYTLAILNKCAGQGHPIVENGIIEWANSKLKAAGKKSIVTNFQDSSISDSRAICDLIDAIKPSSIKYDLLLTENTAEAKMDNARYALACARKIGAKVFALPEDIVEVKPKMVMTIFATLMIKDYQPKQFNTNE